MIERKVVRIAPSHYHVGHVVPATVAMEMGYFEEEGLTNYDVYRGGLIPAAVEMLALHRAMKEKAADIVPDIKPGSVYQLVANQGAELFIVGCWRNSQNYVWIGSKGLTSAKDLKGKKLGVRDIGGIGYTALRYGLKQAGLDPAHDVEWVRGARFHGQEHPEKTLRSGEVDLIHVNANGRAAKELQEEGYPVLLSSKELYPQGRADRVAVANRRMVEEDSDLLVAYLRAIIRSYWLLSEFDKNGWYVRALVRRLRTTCLDEEEAARTTLESGGGSTSGSMVLPFDGGPSETALLAMIEETKEMGDIPEDADLLPCIRLEFVQQAFREVSARPELRDQMERVAELYRKAGKPVAVPA